MNIIVDWKHTVMRCANCGANVVMTHNLNTPMLEELRGGKAVPPKYALECTGGEKCEFAGRRWMWPDSVELSEVQ